MKKYGTYYHFKDWTVIDPNSDRLHEAMHTARYAKDALSQSDLYDILAAAEAYIHFAAHPATTESIVTQLRQLRRVVRADTGANA